MASAFFSGYRSTFLFSCCDWYNHVPAEILRASGAYALQVDKEIPGASWIELPKGTYSIRSDSKKRSRCQLEVDVFFNHMKSHPCKGEWNKVAPLRILSFDIECAGRKGHFPEVRPIIAYLTAAAIVVVVVVPCG